MFMQRIFYKSSIYIRMFNRVYKNRSHCRPCRLAYEKETTKSIKTEYERIRNEIENIQPTVINHENTVIKINHEVLITMLDGKSINAIEGNRSTQVKYKMYISNRNLINQY